MIRYGLVIPSASRPHLFERVLRSLLDNVDQPPERIIVHDDAVFPGKQDHVRGILSTYAGGIPSTFLSSNPPIGHGPALQKLLTSATSEYVLYSQDDHIVLRSLPIGLALSTMAVHGLNQIRFNKRATMGWKGTWQKKEVGFGSLTMTVSDHWYFQTGLWRRSVIMPVVDWWMRTSNAFSEHAEVKVNRTMNGQVPEYPRAEWMPPPELDPMNASVRQAYQKTFIYGPIGEDRYIHHVGGDVTDWAMYRPRGGESGSDKDSQADER